MPEDLPTIIDGNLNVQGEINMEGSEDLTISIPKNSGKYFIDIHPIE